MFSVAEGARGAVLPSRIDAMDGYNNSVDTTNYWIGMSLFVVIALGGAALVGGFASSNIMDSDFNWNPPKDWENPIVKLQQMMENKPLEAEVLKNTIFGLGIVVGGWTFLRCLFSAALYTRGRLS